jgi:hypothetical protein
MEKTAEAFDFSLLEKLMALMIEDHTASTLAKVKDELNKFFIKSSCKSVIYTTNTDNLFFGIKVYPSMNGNDMIGIMGDADTTLPAGYFVEFDSKLFDPMLMLDEKELTALLIYEVGHIAYDTDTIDEVRKQIDIYFTKSDECFNLKSNRSYREVLAYAMKDSIAKVGSIFSKIGNNDIIADSFIIDCGYGAYLQSAVQKISRSDIYLNKSVDDRLLTLAWVLRLNSEFSIRRLPAIRTLTKAKSMTASELEKRELKFTANILNNMNEPVIEGVFENIKNRFSKKFADFKAKGIRSVKNDVYELNLRLRCANTESDLLYIIRTLNTDIAILRDYLTEDISDEEREEIYRILQDMYDIRDQAAKKKEIRNAYDSLIQVVYPDL